MTEKSNKFADLQTRILTAIAMAAVAGGALWLGGYWVVGLLSLAVVTMLLEFRYIILGKLSVMEPGLWVMVLTGAGSVFLTYRFGWIWALMAILAGCAALVQRNRAEWGWLAAGLAYIAISMTLLQALATNVAGGFGLVIWVIAVVVAADICAYFAGRTIGGPKLWPAISPKKTWSGVLGGWVGAALVGLVLGLFGNQTVQATVILSLILAVASQCGDLLESWLKRRHNIKDSGFILPGHGGLLDRLDGLMAALLVHGLLLLLLK
ncbi:MAG TPA: phosphatidate cytidylyltransferase [Paracoccaceae bacterium]|nr:phosphatidate cytidylyltransferase [Paracoccaceae bacterium]